MLGSKCLKTLTCASRPSAVRSPCLLRLPVAACPFSCALLHLTVLSAVPSCPACSAFPSLSPCLRLTEASRPGCYMLRHACSTSLQPSALSAEPSCSLVSCLLHRPVAYTHACCVLQTLCPTATQCPACCTLCSVCLLAAPACDLYTLLLCPFRPLCCAHLQPSVLFAVAPCVLPVPFCDLAVLTFNLAIPSRVPACCNPAANRRSARRAWQSCVACKAS